MRRIHPQFRIFGTLTGRLAGTGKFSIHQQPKSEGYLSSWEARKGKKWIGIDFKSIEDVVLAEMSRDPALLKLYGPGANPAQDAYLFTGSKLPIIGEKILAAGYDENNPTKEIIEKVKKLCKRERQVAKTIKLGLNYGAGPKKLRETLALDGIDISFKDACTLHSGYWQLYSGVKQFEQQLLHEWEKNGGWVLNGIGRPVCCYVDSIKDIISRTIQSTAHDIHMMHVDFFQKQVRESGISFEWVVVDWHDQLIVEVDEDKVEQTLKISKEVMRDLNTHLGGLIPLQGEAVVGQTMWEVK